MINNAKESLWQQFGASLDMLENAINACPDEHWATEAKFWYQAFHCLFFLDYYLTMKPKTFSPPTPFTLSEFNPDGEMPDRVYSKEELLKYTQFCREKCRKLIAGLDEAGFNARWVNTYKDYSIVEILLYNMRHVQHHAAQLNLILRQTIDDAPDWVSRVSES
jgi:DinB superfamily